MRALNMFIENMVSNMVEKTSLKVIDEKMEFIRNLVETKMTNV